MTFLDASAIIAILARESEGATMTARLGQATGICTSPIAVFEAVLGMARIGNMAMADAQAVLDRFLEEVGARIVPVTASIGRDAIQAFDRFGKGRHAAKLNMGDCFAYACARDLGAPLLFKGNDFPQTDIEVA
ncbi:MAG: type II toxin-antitoxin system VapC family toxin [Hyphomicrobiales bacterium]